MKALIVAGGFAKRLGNIAAKMPKALVEVRGKPVAEHLIIHLRKAGITDIIFCTGHLSEEIERYFGDGSKWGVSITYSKEAKSLGTGGAIKNAERLIDGTFLVVYGDILVDMDLGLLISFHKSKGGLGTLTVHPSSHPYDSDIIEVADDSSISRFLGKPKPGQKFTNLANAGVYCFERSILKYFPAESSMLDKEVLPSVLEKGGRLFAYVTHEKLLDIGTIERLNSSRGE
jgi:mannose-1-phosphate guanylyltransferase